MTTRIPHGKLVRYKGMLLVRGDYGGGNGITNVIPSIIEGKIPFAQIGTYNESNEYYFYATPVDIINISEDDLILE